MVNEMHGHAAPTAGLAFTASPHLVHSSKAVVAWFTDPPGVVIQMVQAIDATVSMAQWMANPVRQALLARFPASQELTIVLDLRLMTGRDPGARGALVEPAKQLKARVARTILLPPENASRVYLGSLYALTALLSAVGIHIDIHHSLREILAPGGLRAAPR